MSDYPIPNLKMSSVRLLRRTALIWCVLTILPALVTIAQCCALKRFDKDYVSVEEDEEELAEEVERVFMPTREWKVVREGQSIPAGLHVRMNLQTGLKEAKLLDEEMGGNEVELQDSTAPSADDKDTRSGNQRRQVYGESDRRGVVNKRTKAFSTQEVVSMLQELDQDSAARVNSDHLPRIASATPVASAEKNKPRNIPRTSTAGKPEEQRETRSSPSDTTTRPRDLPLSLHKEVEEMLELTHVLANSSSSVAELCQALEELEYYVHQIQNARDLNVIGGLVLVVRLLNHTHPDVRSWASRVIGSASQRYVC